MKNPIKIRLDVRQIVFASPLFYWVHSLFSTARILRGKVGCFSHRNFTRTNIFYMLEKSVVTTPAIILADAQQGVLVAFVVQL